MIWTRKVTRRKYRVLDGKATKLRNILLRSNQDYIASIESTLVGEAYHIYDATLILESYQGESGMELSLEMFGRPRALKKVISHLEKEADTKLEEVK